MNKLRTLLLLGALALSFTTSAQVPQLLNYQGRVAVGTTNFDGGGSFKFALVNAAGTTTFWSNDGTSAAGSQPAAAVALTVTKGLYSVLLGDTSLPNMTAIPASVWANPDVRLRVWFNDGTNGSQLLTPDQRLAPNGYLPDGAVGPAALASGAVTSGKLAGGAVGSAQLAAGAVGNAQLANSALTVTAGSGLGGGGAVSLGGNVTLNNSGVLSLTGGGGITADASTGAITLGSNATTASTPNTLVKRDGSGNFNAFSATNFSGTLAGEVTGTQDATVVGTVGGVTAANVASGANLANAGTNLNTGSTLVKRDASGNFVANKITGDLVGNATTATTAATAATATTATTATNFSGSLAGDVTGPQGATAIASVGGVTAANVASGVNLANAATNANTASTIVKRDGSGNFSAGAINLPPTSSASLGVISQNGVPLLHSFGTNNVFAGATAGNFTMTGHSNTASGRNALTSNTSGNANTATGREALSANTQGVNNTASGKDALTSNTLGANNTAGGMRALYLNDAGNSNTASGFSALFNNTSGAANTAVGEFALDGNTIGSNNTAIGDHANVASGALTNATAIGANAYVDASNKVRLGNTTVTVIQGQVAFTFASDRNLKENFQPVDGPEVLRKIRGFHLTSWNYIGHDAGQFRHYGPMAQDFFAAFGHDAVGIIGTPTSINSGDMAGILMSAVQALDEENAALRVEAAATHQHLAELEARLTKVEQFIPETPKAAAATAALKKGD